MDQLTKLDFGRLYDEFMPKIYRYVYYRTHHKETAEDLTSLIFTRAFEEFASYDQLKGSFSSWIYRIAHNAVIDHYRRLKQSVPLEDVWDALRSAIDLPRDIDVQTKLDQVNTALSQLPAPQREILILKLWDGYSYAEIAELTGKTEAACKMSVSRTIKVLRETLPLAVFLSILIGPHL